MNGVFVFVQPLETDVLIHNGLKRIRFYFSYTKKSDSVVQWLKTHHHCNFPGLSLLPIASWLQEGCHSSGPHVHIQGRKRG